MNPLRILMICHAPWDRNLGGARVQLELADEFRAAGHSVDKFSFEDAFPAGRSLLGECLAPRAFALRARAFVRANADSYDVIDAHQGTLPYPKRDLRFSGLLVARSVGLYALYARFSREEAVRWPHAYRGTKIGRALRFWRDWLMAPTCPRSLRMADLINVCNPDEMAFVSDVLEMGDKCVNLPFGLSASRRELFRETSGSAAFRLAEQTVAFIGYWAPRKGSLDWAEIVCRVWSKRPAIRFLFLGTGRDARVVLRDLRIVHDDRVKVIPSFTSDELPSLLRNATVGAFPSYVEGFPFGILELTSAGLPTIAYDVPGGRELAGRVDPRWLVPPGDATAFSNQLLSVLEAAPSHYQSLAEATKRIAADYDWPTIASDTLAVYKQTLVKLEQ